MLSGSRLLPPRYLNLKIRRKRFGRNDPRSVGYKLGTPIQHFFRHFTIQRKRENIITKIKDDCGNWVEDLLGIRRSFEVNFRNLFRFSGNRD
ncbi:hypothetical protein ACFX1X_043858 [Malus domestica]